jgi:hypothetical protein
MFCKNAAFYMEKGHRIVIAVNKTSIQLQVFTRKKSMKLNTKRVMTIRKKLERIINTITKTFHKQVPYEIGYSCKDINITEEDVDNFCVEGDVRKESNSDEATCPKHESHDIKAQDLLRFWNQDPTPTACIRCQRRGE